MFKFGIKVIVLTEHQYCAVVSTSIREEHHSCFNNLETVANNELTDCKGEMQWLVANKLSLKVVKTECLLLCSINV